VTTTGRANRCCGRRSRSCPSASSGVPRRAPQRAVGDRPGNDSNSSARAVRGFAAWPGATGCTITATSSYLLGVSSTTADRILGTAPDPAATPGQLNHPECCGLPPAQKAAAPFRHIVDATDLDDSCARRDISECNRLRLALPHMIEETARRAGHADLTRETSTALEPVEDNLGCGRHGRCSCQ
jgi:hypothetical protein